MPENIKGMANNVEYWLEMSDYDYETAIAMMNTRRYLYVGFMCHQTIEKALKAYWSSKMDTPPLKIHSLSRLAALSGLIESCSEEQMDFFDALEPLNIEARYPTYKEQLIRHLSPEYCQRLLHNTKEFQSWIKTKLSE